MPFALDPGGRHKRMIARVLLGCWTRSSYLPGMRSFGRLPRAVWAHRPESAVVRFRRPPAPAAGGPNGDCPALARSNSLTARGIGPFGHAPAEAVTRLTRPPISAPADSPRRGRLALRLRQHIGCIGTSYARGLSDVRVRADPGLRGRAALTIRVDLPASQAANSSRLSPSSQTSFACGVAGTRHPRTVVGWRVNALLPGNVLCYRACQRQSARFAEPGLACGMTGPDLPA